MHKYLRQFIFAICLMLALNCAYARDFYVKSGARRGRGTKERPYKGIYKALKKAIKGDVIHVTQGKYHGKLKAGYIIIPGRGITLLGGYNDDFSVRNPWKYHSIIERNKKSKASTFDYGLISLAKDHAGTIIDGFVLDAGTRNAYRGENLDVALSLKEPMVQFIQPNCQLRNCLVINAAFIAFRMTGKNCAVKNCVFANNVQYSIDVYGTKDDTPFIVNGNTFVKTWKHYSGNAINIGSRCQLTIEKNLFALNDEYAVTSLRNSTGHVMNGNAFFKNGMGLYKFFNAENKASLAIDDPEDLEDADLEEAEDNFIADPQFKQAMQEKPVEEKPVETKPVEKKPDNDDPFANTGPEEDKGKDPFADSGEKKDPFAGKDNKKKKSAFAPRMSIAEALSFLHVQNEEVSECGAQLKGPFPIIHSAKTATIKRDYEKIDYDSLYKAGQTYVGKAVKVKCAMIQKQSYISNYMLVKGVSGKSHILLKLRSHIKMKGGRDVILAYVEKGSVGEIFISRKVSAVGRWRKPARRQIFYVKGVVVAVPKFNKNAIGIIADSIGYK